MTNTIHRGGAEIYCYQKDEIFQQFWKRLYKKKNILLLAKLLWIKCKFFNGFGAIKRYSVSFLFPEKNQTYFSVFLLIRWSQSHRNIAMSVLWYCFLFIQLWHCGPHSFFIKSNILIANIKMYYSNHYLNALSFFFQILSQLSKAATLGERDVPAYAFLRSCPTCLCIPAWW